MLLQEAVPIGPEDDAGTLHDRLAATGARLVLRALADLAAATATARPQPAEGATYAAKLTREDERLDWRRPAAALARQVRALSPRPGAWFAADGDRIKVLAAEPVAARVEGLPGTVLDDRLAIACGEEALRLTRLQRAGGTPMAADTFLRGYRLPRGTALPLPPEPQSP
jgi:methionyl-tRNA formyltransferase